MRTPLSLLLILTVGCVADVSNSVDPSVDPPAARLLDAQADDVVDAMAASDAKKSDSAIDSGATDSGVVADSGLVDTGVDSGVVVDSGVPMLRCMAQNYGPRDCVSQGQDFYVVESCGMNCWTTTPCLQKNPHCPQGDTCKFTNAQNQIVMGVCQ